MSAVYFTLVAVALYVICDRIVDALERRAGRRFEHRSILFFVLLLATSMAAFGAIRRFLDAP